MEILLLGNGSLIAMPSYHRGNEEGDIFQIHLTKEGKSGYLVRSLASGEQKVVIPLDRSQAHCFQAH